MFTQPWPAVEVMNLAHCDLVEEPPLGNRQTLSAKRERRVLVEVWGEGRMGLEERREGLKQRRPLAEREGRGGEERVGREEGEKSTDSLHSVRAVLPAEVN